MPRVDDERHPGVYLNSSVMPIPGINDERTLLVLQVYQCSCDCRKVLVSHGGIPGRNLCERSIRVCLDADRQAGQSNGLRVSSFIVETHIFKGTLHVLVLMLFNFTQ